MRSTPTKLQLNTTRRNLSDRKPMKKHGKLNVSRETDRDRIREADAEAEVEIKCEEIAEMIVKMTPRLLSLVLSLLNSLAPRKMSWHRTLNQQTLKRNNIVKLLKNLTRTAIDKSPIKAWQHQQEGQAKMVTISSNSNKTIAEATEKLVIFKHRARVSKFTMATKLMISKTTPMAILIMDKKPTTGVGVIAVNAEVKDRTSRTSTTRKMAAEVEAEVVVTKENLKSMTRRRNSAGPRKNTSLVMKVKNLLEEVDAEVVAEATAPKSASMMVMMVITREKTEVKLTTPKSSTTTKEETTEVINVNTTKVVTT